VPRRVVVLHFNPPNLDKRLARLSGLAVETVTPKGSADLKPLRERPPDVFVVDLDRRPSEGRSVAVQLRRYVSTRAVPIVFAGGEEEQVARVRNVLPDAA
jgi:DNA-binding response OmpR family regulator